MFEKIVKADIVLQLGLLDWIIFKEKHLHVERWAPEAGCFYEWHLLPRSVVGLLIHLWEKDFFKNIGDACGGFMAADEDTTLRCNIQGSRILVRSGVRGPTCSACGGGAFWFFHPALVGSSTMDGSGRTEELSQWAGGHGRYGGTLMCWKECGDGRGVA